MKEIQARGHLNGFRIFAYTTGLFVLNVGLTALVLRFFPGVTSLLCLAFFVLTCLTAGIVGVANRDLRIGLILSQSLTIIFAASVVISMDGNF